MSKKVSKRFKSLSEKIEDKNYALAEATSLIKELKSQMLL